MDTLYCDKAIVNHTLYWDKAIVNQRARNTCIYAKNWILSSDFRKQKSFNKLCPSQSSWMSFLHNVVYMFHPMPIATFKVQLQSSQSNRILHKIKQGLPSKKTVGKNNRIMACIKKNKLLKSRQTSFYSCHRTTHSLWTQYQP